MSRRPITLTELKRRALRRRPDCRTNYLGYLLWWRARKKLGMSTKATKDSR